MTSTRYKKIVENLHCNNNAAAISRGDPGFDKLHKIRPVIEEINATSKIAYSPSSAFAVDECMVKFKGRSSLKQYMPLKPIKHGYKVWCLADSKTG
jgi:hypothetical protein